MASTATKNVLVTLACPHFAVFPPSVYGLFSRSLAHETTVVWRNLLRMYSKTDRSMTDLSEHSPGVVISTHLTCGRPECSGHHQNWRPELERILRSLQDLLETRKSLYIELGRVYYSMLPVLPASAVNGETAVLVHRQYVTETRDWKQDPFFDSFREALATLEAAMSAAHQPTFAPTQDVLRYIARVTSDSFQMMNEIWELKRLSTEHLESGGHSSVHLPRPSRRIPFAVQRDIEGPKVIFSRVACKAWERRMAGFENFGKPEAFEQQPQMGPETEPMQLDDEEELPTLRRYPSA